MISFDMPPVIAQRVAAQRTVRYDPSWLFDFETGDYITDGAGHVIEASGYEAWIQRCMKVLLTQRYAYPIYSRLYGTNLLKTLNYRLRQLVQSMIQREVTSALLHDPGTGAVRDFKFEWAGDMPVMTITLLPKVGTDPTTVRVDLGNTAT
jgi:hypothetical protein